MKGFEHLAKSGVVKPRNAWADLAPALVKAYSAKQAASVALETPNTSNLRQHWSKTAERNRSQRGALKREVGKWLLTFDPPRLVITVIRVSPRRVDGPNLGSALKAAIDGISDALRIDDGSPVVEWRLEQRKGPAAVEWKLEAKP